MSIAQNAPSADMTEKALGNDTVSELSCSTLPDDGKEPTAINRQRLRESSSSPPPGSLNFTIKSVVPKTTAAGSSISNASTQRVDQPAPAQPRGRSSCNSNPKSRHAVHFASAAGRAKQPGEEDPAQDRSRKAVASPPPYSTLAFSRNHAAAVNPNRVVEVAASAGDGFSRVGRHGSEEPLGDHERRSSAPAAVFAAPVGGMAAAAKANVKTGLGPRQRAVAETAVLMRGSGEAAEVGGGGGGSGSGVEAAPAVTGTFMNQSRLPKLEVPPLAETLQRYLGAVAPLLSPEAFAVTKDVVKEFETSGEGEELQRSLLEYSADKDSYIEEFWDDSYLTANSSVVLNLNPFFVFETPTLSNHSNDWAGGDVSDVAAGNRGRCSSCGSGGGPESRARARSPRRRAARRDRQRSYNDDSPPACYRDHFPRQHHQQQEQEWYRSGSPSRWAGDGNGLSVLATTAGKTQARRAASLLYSSLRFAAAVKSETLPPDIWRDTPLCMAQYRRLFGAHRKAVQNDADEMRVCEDSRHVVVLCRNQFYSFSALHADGRVGVTEEELEEIVLAVQEDAAKARLPDTAARAVGVLTTETRDDWAVSRRKLAAADETNKRYLHLVDTALFVLCLDHTSPCTAAEIAASCLHGSYALEGDAQVGTCTNRWYDKLQIIVFENGAAGVNFEHTWVDGHTVLRFASDVFADVIYRFANHLTSTTGGAHGRDGMGAVFPPDKQPFSLCEGRTPMKMEWHLPKDMRREIYFAETRISDLIRQHDVQALEYDTFGKRFITQNKMSPDAFVQMAIVYGYYGLYGDVVAAYEPVLTKAFLKGRTEALRTVTAEVKAFLEAFCDPETPAKRKILALRSAIVSHGRLVKLAAKGKGVDRHLFALLCMAKMKVEESSSSSAAAATESERKAVSEGGSGGGTPLASPPPYQVPSLFEDEAWRVLNHVILSTSNCGNPSLRLFGFGPVVRDGFGIGYIIKENQLKLVVTSKNRQTDRFVGKIRQFFDIVFNTYSPLQVQGRVRVMSAEEKPEDSGTYSMWGSFSKVS